MADITREQFATAVSTAITSVRHLYREIDRLIVGLRDELAAPPLPLEPIRNTFGKGFGKGSGEQARLVMRNDAGALFGPATRDDEADDDDEEEGSPDDGDTEEEEHSGRRKRRPPVELAAKQPLLAVRIVIYDPLKPDALEPQLQYGVMTEWTLGNTRFAPDETYLLATSMLRRVPVALGPHAGLSKDVRVVTRANVKKVNPPRKSPEKLLACRLPVGVQAEPLYALNSADELRTVVERMKHMWKQVASALVTL
jgi:hypothetical protein